MKIICSKADLVKGVSIVSKAVPSKTTMPILECILIDATVDIIKLTANDMELGIQTEIDGDIREHGMIAIDAKIFSEIVRKLPDSDIVIETDEKDQMTITCEKAKFNIIGKSGEDFSYLPYIEREHSLLLSQLLTQLLSQLWPHSHRRIASLLLVFGSALRASSSLSPLIHRSTFPRST